MFRCSANTVRPTATAAAAATEMTMARRRLRVGFIAWRGSGPATVFLAREPRAEFAQVAAAPGKRGQRIDEEDDEEGGERGPHVRTVTAHGEELVHAASFPGWPSAMSRTQASP